MTAPDGLVYNGEWGATNYLANWNAVTDRDFAQGYRASTITAAKFLDGTSKTIALAEAYATCEGKDAPRFSLGTKVPTAALAISAVCIILA